MAAEAWVVEGRISDNPHQHPIDGDRARDALYVDTVTDGQLVAYVKGEKPPRGAWVRFTGTVLAFETQSKKPGSTKKFAVRQLSVDATERLAGSDAVQKLVDELGDPEVSMERKREAQTAIYGHGKDAFPVLIANLENGRVYEKDLLYELITPVGYTSPDQRVFKPRGSMFVVEDWKEWWRAHRSESLDEIHERMKPLVDEYFRSGGDSQRVR